LIIVWKESALSRTLKSQDTEAGASLIGKNMKSVWGKTGGSEYDRIGDHAAPAQPSGQGLKSWG
jgi:hypothetical protein